MSAKQEFKNLLKEALSHYGIEESVYDSMVANESYLSELRYSSFNAIQDLEVVQFAQGSPIANKPRIYKDVFIFKDINTLLRWMMSVDSGIVVAMIQDTKDLSNSYFVFAVRNGGTLSILTDREKLSHPLQMETSRSRMRGRAFYQRIESYHFPYSIMDIDFGDNNRAYISSSDTALISKEEGIPIRAIKDLEHDEIVWLIMMFSLLEDKFFKENYKTPSLSYTAQMMAEADFLLNEAKGHEVAVTEYKSLTVPKITSEDMKTKNLKDTFDFEPTGQHDWMIERYNVPEEAFDVVKNTDHSILLTGKTTQAEDTLSLKKMNTSSFGSPEQLQKDRLYLARYNQAIVINKKAEQEFYKRKEEVKEWYIGAIRKNLPNLLEAMARGKFVVSKDKEEARVKLPGGFEQLKTNGNIMKVSLLEEYSTTYRTPFCEVYGNGTEIYRSKYTCVMNDSTASIIGNFHPRTANQLAELCGCKKEELHELLLHWKAEKRSPGNSIINNVDPMDWAIKDPWEGLRMDVRIYVSKRAFNQLCKQYNTGNERFWLSKNDESE
ncbi:MULTISPECIES: hypothetical protein [Bacillus]|nr:MULTISPECIES: hypothetical protein [Bacillus]MEC0487160.1 hypothetical protein [Bacillus glycinifermentans]UBF35331.1 hypothetical protein K9N56_23595 [Bacillus sp. PM8313]